VPLGEVGLEVEPVERTVLPCDQLAQPPTEKFLGAHQARSGFRT